jgi:hypothetical protein
MSIICWTEFYQGGPSVSHGVSRLVHVAGRRIRPVVHHASLTQPHVAHVTAQPLRWFKLVCKVIPAGLVGGGSLLAPHPANPPYLHLAAAPAAIVAPGPTIPQNWKYRPEWPFTQSIGALPPTISMRIPPASMPEPSSAAIQFAGVSALLLLRFSVQWLAYSSERIQPTEGQTTLIGRSPVA